jgi:hypothetical protein
MNVLGLFVKRPAPGEVKTRLAASIGPERAAALYAAFVADLADRFRSTADARFLCFAPHSDESAGYFRVVAGDDFKLWPQPDVLLGDRLRAFFDHAFRAGASRAVVIGSDSPLLPAEFVAQAFDQLADRDCVLGPAIDGGYYLVGMRNKTWPIFDRVEWSTARVFDQTLSRIGACGATLGLLPPWHDVDTVEDLARLKLHFRGMRPAGSSAIASRTEKVLVEQNVES